MRPSPTAISVPSYNQILCNLSVTFPCDLVANFANKISWDISNLYQHKIYYISCISPSSIHNSVKKKKAIVLAWFVSLKPKPLIVPDIITFLLLNHIHTHARTHTIITAGTDVYRAIIACIFLFFLRTLKSRLCFIFTMVHSSPNFPDSTPSAQPDFLWLLSESYQEVHPLDLELHPE